MQCGNAMGMTVFVYLSKSADSCSQFADSIQKDITNKRKERISNLPINYLVAVGVELPFDLHLAVERSSNWYLA